jgi:hypothetical protein
VQVMGYVTRQGLGIETSPLHVLTTPSSAIIAINKLRLVLSLHGKGGVGARSARRRRAVGGAMAANFSDYTVDGDDRSSGTSFPVNTDSGMVFRIVRQLCPHTLIVRPKYPPWLSVNSLVFSLRHWSLTVFTTLPTRLRYFSINGILEKSNYTSYRINFCYIRYIILEGPAGEAAQLVLILKACLPRS